MKATLPVSGFEAEIRDFIPHRVVTAFNEAMYKGVKLNAQMVAPTKEELLQEFGAEEIRKLDELPEADHEKRLGELKSDYLSRRMEIEGVTLGNANEAAMQKVLGMALSVDGKPVTRDLIDDLPHEDFEFLQAQIEEVGKQTSKKKASAPPVS